MFHRHMISEPAHYSSSIDVVSFVTKIVIIQL